MSHDDKEQFNLLIPELKLWNNGDGVNANAWIGMVGRCDLAIGYSLVFWPQFVEFDGYVLLEGFSEELLRGFEKQTGNDRKAVEAVMNHIHIADIHPNEENLCELQLRYLGRKLRDI